MSELERDCVNHPGRATRVRCSSCENPICVSCMRETPVGLKCPDCARQPLRVRFGKPRHYLAAAGAGGAASVVSGVLMGLIPFLGIFAALLFGFFIGDVVDRAGRRQSLLGMRWLVVLIVVVGMSAGALTVGASMVALLSGRWLLTIGIASGVAFIRVGT